MEEKEATSASARRWGGTGDGGAGGEDQHDDDDEYADDAYEEDEEEDIRIPRGDGDDADDDDEEVEQLRVVFDEEIRAILGKATSGRILTADEKARLKAATVKEEERRRKERRRRAKSAGGGGGGQDGRRSSDSTAAAAPKGPAAWRTDTTAIDFMNNVKGRPDMARKHRYKTACRDIEFIGKRRQIMKQRFKDAQVVENQEAKLLVMWFQARKIQRAFHAYNWRVNAKVGGCERPFTRTLKTLKPLYKLVLNFFFLIHPLATCEKHVDFFGFPHSVF